MSYHVLMFKSNIGYIDCKNCASCKLSISDKRGCQSVGQFVDMFDSDLKYIIEDAVDPTRGLAGSTGP